MIDGILARGLLPDRLIRFGIRRAIAQRLREIDPVDRNDRRERLERHVRMLRQSPIAIATDEANTQHYEVPAKFFELVLGPHLKYSCSFWPDGVDTLARAEEAMLELTTLRAGIENGQKILELGCGWGSLTLWMAERYPESSITAVSNSSTQREWIESRAAERGLSNVSVLTRDMRSFDAGERFDRIVSVEMFEHMRNYEKLLHRISGWLEDEGRLFVHVFSHAHVPYLFEDRGPSDWMARHFFTGGQMPSDDLLPSFQDHLTLHDHYTINGIHYQKTAEAWLERMDRNAPEIREIFREVYGEQARRFFSYWRVFFMAVSELWGTREGEEWIVSHYLFGAK